MHRWFYCALLPLNLCFSHMLIQGLFVFAFLRQKCFCNSKTCVKLIVIIKLYSFVTFPEAKLAACESNTSVFSFLQKVRKRHSGVWFYLSLRAYISTTLNLLFWYMSWISCLKSEERLVIYLHNLKKKKS